ncbi:HAD family hydrolase [Bacillus sp. B1-b2]|uniref:HAD family hydrolase n=1 Tax=Bacillus sp. B1-b2 TaxID=2653201 RepID=UPI0012614A7D|nr:HAD family hydrolase [Bacillus sp. B1-b2]KAB7673015.1 hypothetical protein F9279_00900 [Bacillus sp. B1-b2]
MKMFASDLDRTLIYSKRALEELQTPLDKNMIPVEEKNGEYSSFMTKNSFSLLKELATNHLLVPVTTRTYEQYKRVFIFESKIPVTYAVTNNGAKIHYKGKLLKEWEESVQVKLKQHCMEKEKVIDQILDYKLNGTLKIADNHFFYYLLDSNLAVGMKETLVNLTKQFGWKVSLQGRKLYFMPNPVCKGEAIKYIAKRERVTTLAGAGDSVLDFPFLNVSDYPIIPRHGELVLENVLEGKHLLTDAIGAYAGEEIVNKIHQHFLD